MCISDRFSEDAEAAGMRNTLENQSLHSANGCFLVTEQSLEILPNRISQHLFSCLHLALLWEGDDIGEVLLR